MGKSNIANIHTSYSAARDYGIKFYSFIYDSEFKFYGSIKTLENKFDIENNPTAVFGRQDPIMTFSRIGRSIDLTFYVPSATFEDADINLNSLNRLIQYQYPAFKKSGQANTISASPLLKLKVANLIYDNAGAAEGTAKDSGLVIAMTSLSHKFDFGGDTAWYDERNEMIPMGFEVSLSAVVLHSHALGSEFGRSALPDPDNYPYGNRTIDNWWEGDGLGNDAMPSEPAPASGPMHDDGGLFGPYNPSSIPGMSSTTSTSDITGA